MTCDHQQLIRDIQAVLRPVDLDPKWRKRAEENPDIPLLGYCAPATEVLQALLWECGERQWKTRYAKEPNGDLHYWLVDPGTGEILDPTAEQYRHRGVEPPYGLGQGGGFMGTRWPEVSGQKVRRPSRRALNIIQRINSEPARRITERFAQTRKGTTMRLYRHKNHLYREAIRREELERYEQLQDTELQGLEQPEFADLVDAVMTDLSRMEEAVRKRKQLFDRLKKLRLAQELEGTRGRVVELSDMVMMLTEQPGRTSWKKLIDKLTELHPELADILQELQQEFTGEPAPMIKKYRRTKEPKGWKSKEHVPLREVGARYAELDETATLRRIRSINQRLDRLIDSLAELVVEQPLERAARTRFPRR